MTNLDNLDFLFIFAGAWLGLQTFEKTEFLLPLWARIMLGVVTVGVTYLILILGKYYLDKWMSSK